MQSYSYGQTPPEAIRSAMTEPFPMTIRSQDEWAAIAAAWNMGIDSHLEAMARSTADASSGKVVIHPEEMTTFLRRLSELDPETLWPDWDYERESNPAENLRSSILTCLEIEEI